jgi:hypothetical protein
MKALKLANQFRTVSRTLEAVHYPSIHQFVEAIKPHENLPKDSISGAHCSKGSWAGSSNMEEAFQIVSGFNNKVAEIKTGLAKVEQKQFEFTPQANKYSGRVNVASMLSGVENCRIRFREEAVAPKLISIYIQMNALSNINASNFVNKAVAVANAVNNLERAGYRVEVIGYSYSKMTAATYSLITIKVKHFEDTLSLGQLYGIFAPSTFRRLIFRHIELYFTASDNVPSGYGYSADWNSPAGTINIPRSQAFDNLDDAVNFVNNRISQLKNAVI